MTQLLFVKETPTAWVYEGLAIPFGGPVAGQDLTGSHFTKDTDLCLDWFPNDGRPVLYRHGFDPDVKAVPVGTQTATVKVDDKGRWVRLQIEKAKEYASEVKQLLDEGVLGLSTGAVDHLVHIASKDGAIKQWPWVELSVVPNMANPEALLYPVKAVDAIEHIRIVATAVPEAIREAAENAPSADPEPETDTGASPDTEDASASIPGGEGANPEGTPDPEPVVEPPAAHEADDALLAQLVAAVREGRRNSTLDMASIQAIHDATQALGAMCSSAAHQAPEPQVARLAIVGTAPVRQAPDLTALGATLAEHAVATAKTILNKEAS